MAFFFFFSRISCISGSLIILLALVCEAKVPSSGGFIGTQNTQFVLNGSPFFFNGFNSYWMMNTAVDPNERYKVSNVFRDAKGAGLTVCRTLAFSDGGYSALQISPGNYDEKVFQALDFVISEAKKNGIRLILSLVNNWKDYGGRAQYVQWGRTAGQKISKDDDFYTNPLLKKYYKNHVKRVLTRLNTITGVVYKNDPIVTAWKLMNEPRCEVDSSGKLLNGWIQEMATYVKSLDKKHLLEVGMEGFYGDSIPKRKQINPNGYLFGTDFITNNLIKEIDFSTIHAYPDVWLYDKSDKKRMAFLQTWMESHWTDSRRVLKKPVVFSEFGKSKKVPGFRISIRDSFLNTIYSSIYKYARTGGTVGGGLVWQIFPEGMESYHDDNEIVLTKDRSTKKVISKQSHLMTTLNHKNKKMF